MVNFPYTVNSARIKPLFEKVRTSGVPDKVTFKTLQAWGFKSNNDRRLLTMLKFVGFVDSAHMPTQIWSAYRSNKNGPAVLAEAIRSCYASLFQLYPDAHQKDNEALRHFFSTTTSVGSETLNYMVRTFKTLCEIADFEAKHFELANGEAGQTITKGQSVLNRSISTGASGLIINVNIQLTLPATENLSIYENLFAAMKKYILT